MNKFDIISWQKRFRDQPTVWATIDENGFIHSIYESKEAAECEILWCTKKFSFSNNIRIQKFNIHSLELAEERWKVKD